MICTTKQQHERAHERISVSTLTQQPNDYIAAPRVHASVKHSNSEQKSVF
jgi:putative heme iron utilization protein